MGRFFILLILIIGSLGALPARSFADEVAAAPIELDPLATAFGRPDARSLPALSPGGSMLALLEWDKDSKVVIYDVSDPDNVKQEISFYAEEQDGKTLRHDQHNRLIWLSDTKLLMDVSVRRTTGGCKGEHCYFYVSRRWKMLDLETRQLSSPYSKEFPNYFRRPNGVGFYHQAFLVHRPDSADEPFLVWFFAGNRGVAGNPSVYALDKETAEPVRIVRPEKHVYSWLADRNGEIRFAFEERNNRKKFVRYRNQGDSEWTRMEWPSLAEDAYFDLIAFSNEPDEFYVISNHEGGPNALYRYHLPSYTFREQVYADPRFDVTSVSFDENGQVEAVYAGEEYVPIQEVDRKAIDAIQAIGGQGDWYSTRSFSYGRTRKLIEVSSSDLAGSFYLYDRAQNKAWKIGDRRELQDDVELGSKYAFQFEARDGLELDVYLALPAGLTPDTAQNLPFVLMPHGGPWQRDFAAYDDLTQLINVLGIGVLKVNFRGSSGYGSDFMELGIGEWGRAMQEDLNDAHDWAISKGWVDPEKTCMVGWSYGGYASLMAGIQDGERYKCVGSIAGVSDLIRLIRTTRNRETLRRIGASSRYDQSVADGVSPLQRASEFSVPLFLAHGTADSIVDYEDHYSDLLKKLKDYDKDVSYIAFKDGNHSLSSFYDRQILYHKLVDFLRLHLLDETSP